MSKIICDICGTTYPDTADCCPICGCSRDSAVDFLGDSFQLEETAADGRKGKFASRGRKEIFDYDEVNSDTDETQILEEEIPEEEEITEVRTHSNTFAIIGLTVLIALLLLFAGFLALRYILPNLNAEAEDQTTAAPVQTEAVPTTSYGIPCRKLVLLSGPSAQLTQPGQYFLLNVVATPEDTTDEITYVSENEAIATVSADGKITAVSEGETVIYITCGTVQMTCPVTVHYEAETQPPTEAPVETQPATEAATEPTQSGLKDVELKLKKTDIMLGVYYEFRLELDCDLDPSEVEWSVEHEHIASVDNTGLVKALKSGTTAVIVKYGQQEVKCMVRCG